MAKVFRLLASAAVIAAVALPLSALAATPPRTTVNTPKGDWVVGPINAPSSSGVGYCSMKNTYIDGLGLVFARDAEGSNSIAVDLQKKLLKTGGQYNVTLKSGAAQRSMSAIAATPTVLIVQMGLDRDFYSVMAKAGSIALDFGAAEISFQLKGANDAMEVLTKCAQALGKGQKFTTTKVAKAAPQPAAAAAPANIEPAVGGDGDFTGYLGGAKEAVPAIERLANKRPDETNLGLKAANEELKQQIAELKVQNRKLLAENQQIAERMINSGDAEAEMEMAAAAETENRERALAAENMRLRAALNELPEPEPAPVAQLEPAAGETVAPAFLSSLLEAANIPASADSRNPEVLVWGMEGEVYGSGEERKLDPKAGLEAAVTAYMNEARGRCPGDFANTSGKIRKLKGKQVVESEIACLDGQNDAAAAVLFVVKGSDLAVISHETAPARMTAALAGRDAVISAISGK
jgi:hypothetical protein